VAVINSPTFASLSDAGDYLADIVEAEDDCTSDVQLQVTFPDSDATCENTMLNVVATDNNCVNDPNPGDHTAERQFIVKVDTQEPDVSIQFDRNGDHFVGEMPTDSAYLFISASDNYANVGFSFSISDTCEQTLRTKISVSSNEFEYDESMSSDNMVLMRKTRGTAQSHSVNVFVAPKQCQSDSSQSLCETDPNNDFRYYQFDVEATDFAGNVGRARAFVFIVPDGSDQDQEPFANFFNGNSLRALYVIQTLDLPWSTAESELLQ